MLYDIIASYCDIILMISYSRYDVMYDIIIVIAFHTSLVVSAGAANRDLAVPQFCRNCCAITFILLYNF